MNFKVVLIFCMHLSCLSSYQELINAIHKNKSSEVLPLLNNMPNQSTRSVTSVNWDNIKNMVDNKTEKYKTKLSLKRNPKRGLLIASSAGAMSAGAFLIIYNWFVDNSPSNAIAGVFSLIAGSMKLYDAIGDNESKQRYEIALTIQKALTNKLENSEDRLENSEDRLENSEDRLENAEEFVYVDNI